MLKDGIALVITPLIALMKDQVQNLNDRGIKALAVYAGMNKREVDLALNNAAYGDVKFLYISPERLNTRLFKSYLEVLNICFIVIDEAHCISQWGYDFRPDYLQIGKIREVVDAPSDSIDRHCHARSRRRHHGKTRLQGKDIAEKRIRKAEPVLHCPQMRRQDGADDKYLQRRSGHGNRVCPQPEEDRGTRRRARCRRHFIVILPCRASVTSKG